MYRMWRISLIIMWGLGTLGCSSSGTSSNIFAPYRGSPNGEELRSPPKDDTRYTQAPSYPPSLLKPEVKMKDSENGTGLRRAPIGGGMGGMGPMGPGAGGF
ncbi:MAG: hypothetical protein U0796_23325 [Gemmatales bacterium]